MTRKILVKATAIIAAIALITSISNVASGANQQPETVRVGLYYKGNSVNTAQSLFDVSAQSGMQVGFFENGSFVEIYKKSGSSALYIRKDSFYYDNGKGLKEFNPSGADVSGTKYGPYHIKIGYDYDDAVAAEEQAAVYRETGIDAFIAYNDAWQVWAGLCIDEACANDFIEVLTPVLGVEAGYEIIQPSSKRIVVTDGKYMTVCIFDSKTASFQVRPAPENNPPVITIKGKQYRGAIEVKRLSNSDMTVINVVSIKEYLYGNVPPEIGGRTPAEALKAQAVASKMYAINNKGKHGSTGFDICDTTHCQVYRGYSVEIEGCNHAIDEVYDKILLYNGKPVKHVYYFASGGGSTEDVRNVWGSTYPYLVSVEDKYEKIYNWTKTLRASDVKAKLPQLGNILGITITRTAPTGRVTQLAVTGASRGEPEYYSNEKCRTLFGLNSQLYTIISDADVFVSGLSDKPKALTSSKEVEQETKATTGAKAAEPDSQAQPIATNGEAQAPDAISADGSESDSSIDKDPAATAEPSVETENGGAVMPEVSDPMRTQLGGKKVITADGVQNLKGKNNKITILGADDGVNKASVVPETYVFTGKGWGHAVGMSQEGAIGMGKAGLSYEEILMHYFQGTKVE